MSLLEDIDVIKAMSEYEGTTEDIAEALIKEIGQIMIENPDPKKAVKVLTDRLQDAIVEEDDELCPVCLSKDWSMSSHREYIGECWGAPAYDDIVDGRTCNNCGFNESI